MSFFATTSGIAGAGIRDPMVIALEHRIRAGRRMWIFDSGDYRIAGKTRSLANFWSFKLADHKLWK